MNISHEVISKCNFAKIVKLILLRWVIITPTGKFYLVVNVGT